MSRIRKIINIVLETIYPQNVTCISCNDELQNDKERDNLLCDKCEKEFQYIGDKVQEIENKELQIDNFYTVYAYDGRAKNLVVGFKDGNKPYIGNYIAKNLFGLIQEKMVEADLICYVPSSKQKKSKRGYDHMRIVANTLSKMSNIKVNNSLGRRSKGADQTETEDRYKNIKGQFYYIEANDIKSKTIILIDDVVTTGATISQCAGLLKQNGAGKVILITFTEAKSFADYKCAQVRRMARNSK